MQKGVGTRSYIKKRCGNAVPTLSHPTTPLVSTKCKAIFAAASFRNSSAQFFKPAWCSNFSKLFNDFAHHTSKRAVWVGGERESKSWKVLKTLNLAHGMRF